MSGSSGFAAFAGRRRQAWRAFAPVTSWPEGRATAFGVVSSVCGLVSGVFRLLMGLAWLGFFSLSSF